MVAAVLPSGAKEDEASLLRFYARYERLRPGMESGLYCMQPDYEQLLREFLWLCDMLGVQVRQMRTYLNGPNAWVPIPEGADPNTPFVPVEPDPVEQGNVIDLDERRRKRQQAEAPVFGTGKPALRAKAPRKKAKAAPEGQSGAFGIENW